METVHRTSIGIVEDVAREDALDEPVDPAAPQLDYNGNFKTNDSKCHTSQCKQKDAGKLEALKQSKFLPPWTAYRTCSLLNMTETINNN